MDPTDAEMASFVTVDTVARWASLRGDPDDTRSPLGSLLVHLDVVHDDPPRAVGIICTDDFNAAVDAWRIHDDPTDDPRVPGASLIARAKSFGRACRLTCGNDYSKEAVESYNWELEKHNRQVELLEA